MSDTSGGPEDDAAEDDDLEDLDDIGDEESDDESVDGTSAGSAASNRGRGPSAKRGVPRFSLKDAVGYAEKLWGAARFGDVALEGFATELGYTPNEKGSVSGRFASKLAAVRSFGLIEDVKGQNGRLKLSKLGLDAVQTVDPGKRQRAIEEALLRPKPYKAILDSLGGAELPPKATLASRFEFDWGLSKSDKTSAAARFIESVSFAGGLTDTGAVDNEEVEEEVEVPDSGPDECEVDTKGRDDLPDADAAKPKQSSVVAPAIPAPPGSSSRGVLFQVTLDLSLDLSRYSADDIVRILGALHDRT